MPPPATAGPLPPTEQKREVVESMFDRIAPSYERMNRLISFGLDRRWRRHALDDLGAPPGSVVLDLGCGTGDLCRASRARGHRCIGFDFSAEMLRYAATTCPVVRADVCRLSLPDASADAIISGFLLRNLVDLEAFFAECARVLKIGGNVAFIDAIAPEGALARIGHSVWFRRVVPWLGSKLSDRHAYRYLAASTAYLPSSGVLARMLEAAGFARVRWRKLGLGSVLHLEAERR